MHSLLVSQELLLIFHATVLSPKQMANQQLGPTAEDPFRGDSGVTLCGYDNLFTSREKVENSLYPLPKESIA